MKNENKIPVIFSSCIPVKGAERSLICDIQRKAYQFIPNDLFDLLKETKGKSLFEIKKHYNNQYDEIIDEYFEILEKEEYVFFTDNPEWFPNMSMEWDEPTVLTNGIIDIDDNSNFDFEHIFSQLGELGCEHIQLRFYNQIPLKYLNELLEKIGTKRIISVEILLPFYHDLDKKNIEDFINNRPRIFSLVFYGAKTNKIIFTSETGMGHVFYTNENIHSKKQCGIISPDLFTIHIKSFTEAHHHNTCLNRKISIDVNGEIRNCPSMPQSFGNIKDTTLQEALNHPDFKKYWNITKDQIDVCKDCEFRYICTDCRAYIEDPENIYSKPLKCGYDPYTGKWEEWSTHPLKQKAIDYYGMREIL